MQKACLTEVQALGWSVLLFEAGIPFAGNEGTGFILEENRGFGGLMLDREVNWEPYCVCAMTILHFRQLSTRYSVSLRRGLGGNCLGVMGAVLWDAQRPCFSEQSTLPREVMWYPRKPKECSTSAKPQPHLVPLGCTGIPQPRTSQQQPWKGQVVAPCPFEAFRRGGKGLGWTKEGTCQERCTVRE